MTKVAVIGCGVVGAMIAYELSQVAGLQITVFDRQAPAQASTGAALGVLMGAISQKLKGNNLQRRLASLQRYETLIPELEERTQTIPFNREGILRLCFEGEDLSGWQNLTEVRQSQGWQLDLLDAAEVRSTYPQIQNERIVAGIYSPQDRQVDPTQLTLALVTAAQQNGVDFQFHTPIEQLCPGEKATSEKTLQCQLQTKAGSFAVEWVILAAGLGSTSLTGAIGQPVDLRPVLGQALQVQLPHPLNTLRLQPVITAEDIHLVPLSGGNYWIGATVEFPINGQAALPDAASLQAVLQGAIAFYPALAEATIVKTWSGLRPRPEGRPAPIIEHLPGYSNILLATGHYRNGVLLAPATAQAIRAMILEDATSRG